MSKINLSLRLAELVQLGEPTFNSEEINKGIQALPKSLQLLSASVKVLNDSIVKEILGKYAYEKGLQIIDCVRSAMSPE